MLKLALPGKYIIKARYFSSHRQDMSGGTTILLNLFTNYARETEFRKSLTIRLTKTSETFEGTFCRAIGKGGRGSSS